MLVDCIVSFYVLIIYVPLIHLACRFVYLVRTIILTIPTINSIDHHWPCNHWLIASRGVDYYRYLAIIIELHHDLAAVEQSFDHNYDNTQVFNHDLTIILPLLNHGLTIMLP